MNKRTWLIGTITVFLLTNLIFNHSLWKELLIKRTENETNITDSIITEFLLENSYQNILRFKNPFITETIFYPFKINYSLNDPSNSYTIFFFFLRPFLTPHQIILLIVIVSFFLNNLLMYILLRKLKINQRLALVIGLSFGFMPFLSHRVIGHYTYIPIYFFPLACLIIHQFLTSSTIKKKLVLSVGFGLFLAFVLLSNFYYFLMIILALSFYGGYCFFDKRIVIINFARKNIGYILLSSIIFLIVLTPWLISVSQLIETKAIVKTHGFGGAIDFSADLMRFFTPSKYNPFYKKLINKLSGISPIFFKYNQFFLNSWERLVYPGAIIILAYITIIFMLLRKKIEGRIWKKIRPYFFVSLIFLVLMLGPFLKVFNRWSLNLDGVDVVVPLPFLALHYIPGLSAIRAPSRFTPAFVFLAWIVVVYFLDSVFKRIKPHLQRLLLAFLFTVFIIDQSYVVPPAITQKLPYETYHYLKRSPPGTVLEIPFTVRDGFQYLGFVHALQPMYGQLIHQKPIIGGYLARINPEVFRYYQSLPFISYLAKIIDKGNYSPYKEKPKEPQVFPYPYSLDTIINDTRSLNIRYILLKKDEKYSSYLEGLLTKVGFEKKLEELNYLLFELKK